MFNIKTSDFSQAGKAAADDAVRIFAAARRNSPDFGKMAQQAAAIRSKVKQEGINAAAKVTRAGIQTAGQVKKTEVLETAKRGRDKAQRKAGALAAAGKMFATAGQFGGEPRKKREIGEGDSYFDGMISRNNAGLERDRAALAGLEPPGTQSTSTNTQTSGGGDASSATTATPPASASGKFSHGYGNNWNALQTVIRKVEGTSGDKGYTTRFGGHQFTDTSRHPNIAAPTPWGTQSEAAGAFQFMKPTWDEARAALNLTDFSPASQQQAGRFLTDRRGVNPDGDYRDFGAFTSAISKLSPEWAGLPNSANGRSGFHGQANADMKELHNLYLQTLNGSGM